MLTLVDNSRRACHRRSCSGCLQGPRSYSYISLVLKYLPAKHNHDCCSKLLMPHMHGKKILLSEYIYNKGGKRFRKLRYNTASIKVTTDLSIYWGVSTPQLYWCGCTNLTYRAQTELGVLLISPSQVIRLVYKSKSISNRSTTMDFIKISS